MLKSSKSSAKQTIFFILISLFALTFFSCASEVEVPIEAEPIDETLEVPAGCVFFTDYAGLHYFMPLQDAAKHPYNLGKFTKKGQQIFYRDDKYESVLGIDISRHNGRINWKKVKKAGYQFAFIRIGWRGYETGILHVDERFHKNIKGALKAGLNVGVYLFSQAINEEEALEEANLVIEELKNYKDSITMPVVFDPENIYPGPARTDNVSGQQFTKNTIVFLDAIKEAGYDPMIYANLNWHGFYLDIMKLQNYKMWYADYKPLPRTTYNFEFWQYTSSGKIPGTRYKCDLNLWIRGKQLPNLPESTVLENEELNSEEINDETKNEVLPKIEFKGVDDADISDETEYLEYGNNEQTETEKEN